MKRKKHISTRRAQWKARTHAARRRAGALLGHSADPYPPAPAGLSLSPSENHRTLAAAAALPLSCAAATGKGDIGAWQREARSRLAELAGWQAERPVPEERHRETADVPGGLRRDTRYLRVEPDRDVPVHIIAPADGPPPARAMICLHGTNSGAHLAWGDIRLPADHERLAKGADIALQAAARGWLAVVIEQSCFGERREQSLPRRSADPCIDAANHALLLGRTLIGERATDVSAVIDWLLAGEPPHRPDNGRIAVLGHSSGGSVGLLATALDERIAGVVASGSVGFFRDTLMARNDASGQNVIPGILQWLEMDAVVGLCAPRAALLVSGRDDHIWPARGVDAVASAAAGIFAECGVPDHLVCVAADGGHRFYPDETWAAVETVFSHI